jgi:hypothetical protein
MDITKLQKKYPELYLFYHDNSAWTLYKKEPTSGSYFGEAEHDKLILVEGGDQIHGYIPDIVFALCKALNIKVESI